MPLTSIQLAEFVEHPVPVFFVIDNNGSEFQAIETTTGFVITRYENSFSTSFLAALRAFSQEKAKPARKRPPTTDKPKTM